MYFKQNKKGIFCLLKKLFIILPDKKIVTNMLNEACDSAEMEKVTKIFTLTPCQFVTINSLWKWKWSLLLYKQPEQLKKSLKKFRLDQESNPDLCNDRAHASSIKLIKPTGLQAIYIFIRSSNYESFHMSPFNTCKQFVYEQALSSLWFSFTWTDSFYNFQAWCCPSC